MLLHFAALKFESVSKSEFAIKGCKNYTTTRHCKERTSAVESHAMK